MALDLIQNKIHLGKRMNDRKIVMLPFADIAVIAENKEELQIMLRCMKEMLLNELNININTKKIKIIVCT